MISLVFFCALTLFANAVNVDSLTLQALMRPQSSAQVDLVLKQHDQLLKSRLACKVQLRERIVPSECYRALAYEKEIGLLRPDQRVQMIRQLDETCSRSAQSAISQSRPQIPFENQFLSPHCRQDLHNLRRILAYRQSPTWSGN